MNPNFFRIVAFTIVVNLLGISNSFGQAKPGPTYEELLSEGNAPIFPCPTDNTKPLTFTDNGVVYIAVVFNDMTSNLPNYLTKYKIKTADPKNSSSKISIEGKNGRGVFNDAASDLDVTFMLPYYSAKGTILKDYPVIWVDNKGIPICEKAATKNVKYGKWVTCDYNGPIMIKVKQTSCKVIKDIAVNATNIGIGTMTAFVPGGSSTSKIATSGFLTSAAGSAMGMGVEDIAKRIFVDKKLIYNGFLSPKNSKNDCIVIEGSCTSKFTASTSPTKCDGQIRLGRGLSELSDASKNAGKSVVKDIKKSSKKTSKKIKKAFK